MERGRRRNRRLLNVLFILVIVPVLLLLIRSAVIMMEQQKRALEISTRYVSQLSRYAAMRFTERDDVRMRDFLELLSDRGYERILRGPDSQSGSDGVGTDKTKGGESGEERRRPWESRDKFLPGMLAYLRRDGTFIAGSSCAEILPEFYLRNPEMETARQETLTVNGQEMAWCICVWPTKDSDIVVIGAVTMFSWTGGSGLIMGRFLRETMLVALFCLAVLLLLRMVLIRPLRALAFGLRTFVWGQEVPAFSPKEGQVLGIQLEEIVLLRDAIGELAREAVRKTELERRYVSDVVKAQEDERERLAREIHDGPIQVVAALMQRVQMALFSLDARASDNNESSPAPAGRDVRGQLALAEEAAQNVVRDLRGICDSLVPPWISLGLARCMEEEAARLVRQHDIAIDVDMDSAEIDISQERTLAFLRIFQEGVSNAVRHGHATRIDLSIRRDAKTGALVFLLRDNGTGFDGDGMKPEDLRSIGKRGLAGMQQRAESLGGAWSIHSEKGKGTTVEVTFPSHETTMQ
ncbi:MAG: sensor histidine kinase [Synergistaceae bacterium]|jgi:signal transduction histidine kinase|nr:sensor histidine kinase [Synergistaceae bacterium]